MTTTTGAQENPAPLGCFLLMNLQGRPAGCREVDGVRTEAVMLGKNITGFDQPVVFIPRYGQLAVLIPKPAKEEAFFFGEFAHLLAVDILRSARLTVT